MTRTIVFGFVILNLVVAVFMFSCSPSTPRPPSAIDNMGKGLRRFENDEVVCYVYRSYNRGGLSCRWKKL